MNKEKVIQTIKKCIKPLYNSGKMLHYNTQGALIEKGICFSENSRKLFSYKNKHLGERCFLIGTGPSLTAEDLELIKNEHSIGCNMIYKMYEKTTWRPDYHCVLDRLYAKYENHDLVSKIHVPLFVPRSTGIRMKKKPVDTIYVNDIYAEGTYVVRGKMLSYCWLKASVMLFMLELAMFMGFKEIYLLGVDCTNVHGAKGHFTDAYTKEEVTKGDEERLKQALKKEDATKEELGAYNYNRSIEAYTLVENFAKKHHTKIYNATRGGNLEVFERVALENVV